MKRMPIYILFLLFWCFGFGNIGMLKAQTPSKLGVKFESSILGPDDQGDRYLQIKISMKRLSDFPYEEDPDFGDRTDYNTFKSLDLMFWYNTDCFDVEDLGAISFQPEPAVVNGKVFEWTMGESGTYNKIYPTQIVRMYEVSGMLLGQLSVGEGNWLNISKYKLTFDADQYKLWGTLKWKLKKTATGTTGVKIRTNEEYHGYNCATAISFVDSNCDIDLVFTGETDISVGGDKPLDPPVLINPELLVCNPAKQVFYQASLPTGASAINWFIAEDAAGTKLVGTDVAVLTPSEQGQVLQVDWKARKDAKDYYLVCYAQKADGTKSAYTAQKITVIGFPDFNLTETKNCRQTQLSTTETGGTWWNPDYSASLGTNIYTVKKNGTYHYERINNTCKDTVDIPVTLDVPQLAWHSNLTPPASVNVGDVLSVGVMPTPNTAPINWLIPADGAGSAVTINKAVDAYYEFKVYAGENGCYSDTLYKKVEVTGGGVIPNLNVDEAIACKNGAVYLSCAPEGGSAPYKCEWFVEGTSTVDNEDFSWWVKPDSDVKYVIRVTDTKGASATDTVSIKIDNTKEAYVIAAGGPFTVAKNGQTVLTAEVTANGSSAGYAWNWEPASEISGSATEHYPWTNARQKDTTYQVYVKDDNGCFSEPAYVNVKVDAAADALAVAVDPEAKSLCAGNSLDLQVKAIKGSLTGATVAWQNATGVLDDVTSSAPKYTATAPGGEYVVLVTKNGKTVAAKTSIIVDAAQAPQLALAGGAISCTGDSVWVKNIGSVIPDAYKWEINGAAPVIGDSVYLIADAGNLKIKVYATKGACASDTLSVTATIGKTPVVDGWLPQVATCEPTAELKFTTVDPSSSGFVWLNPDKSVLNNSGVKNITVNSNGEYHLVIQNNACVDTLDVNVLVDNQLSADGWKNLVTSCGNAGVNIGFTFTSAVSFEWQDAAWAKIPGSDGQLSILAAQEGEYHLILDGGTCKDTLDTKVEFGKSPLLGVANKVTTCGNKWTLNATTTGGNLVWAIDDQFRILITDPFVQQNGSNPQTIYVQAQDGACTSGVEAVNVHYGTVPQLNVQKLQTACGIAHTLTATATGGQVYWLEENEHGQKVQLPSTQVKGNKGDVKYYYAYAKDSDCNSDTVRVEVRFGESPILDVVKQQTSCSPQHTLVAQASAGEIFWKKQGETNPLSSLVVTPGDGTTYFVYAKDRECETDPVKVEVKFSTAPTVTALALQTTCGEGPYTLQATASGEILHWLAPNNRPISGIVTGTAGTDSTYHVYAGEGSCISEIKEVNLKFGTSPIVDVKTPITTCGTKVNLEATATGGDLVWFEGVTKLPLPVGTGNAGETKVYTVKAVDGMCESASKELVVTYGTKPKIEVTEQQTACLNEITLQATTTAGELHWLDKSYGPVNNVVTSADGEEYHVYAEDGACKSDTADITVSFGKSPIVNVQPLFTTCGTSLKLEASASGGNVIWKKENGDLLNSLMITPSDGTVFYAEAVDKTCSSVPQRVEVAFGTAPKVTALKTQTFCEANGVLKAEVSSATAQLKWLDYAKKPYPAGPSVNGLKGTQKNYYVYAMEGSCVGDTVEITAQFGVDPVVTVQDKQTTCGNSLQLEAFASAGNLIWKDQNNQPLTSTIVSAADGTIFYVSAQDRSCTSTEKLVEVAYGVAPLVNVLEKQTSCEDAFTLSATATAGNIYWLKSDYSKLAIPEAAIADGNPATYFVYAKDGSCISDTARVKAYFGTAPDLEVQPEQTTCGKTLALQATTTGGELIWMMNDMTELPSNIVNVGNGTIYYVKAKDGACVTGPVKITAAFGAKPSLSADLIQTTCENSYVLTAQSSGESLHWLNSTYQQIASSTVTKGENTSSVYFVYAGSGTCVSDTARVEVLFGTAPIVEAISPQTTCDEPALTLQATTSGGKLKWTTLENEELTTSVVPGDPGDIKYYFVQAIESDKCVSEKKKVEIRFGEKPVIDVEKVQTTCSASEYTLKATASAGDIHWLKADRKTALATTLVKPADGNEFYAYAVDGTCYSDTVKVNVMFNTAPVLTVEPVQSSCGGSIRLVATTTGGELIWTDSKGQTVPSGIASGSGEQVYTVVAKDKGCESMPKQVTVRFGSKPDVMVDRQQTACETEHTLIATATGGDLQWLASDKKTYIAPEVSGVKGATSVYYVYAAQGECSSDTVKVEVAYGAEPVVTVDDPQTTCGNSIQLQASATGGVLVWEDVDGNVVPSVVTTSGIYYVHAEDATCISAARKVSVKLGTRPEVHAGDLTACGLSRVLDATASAGTLVWLDKNKVKLPSITVPGNKATPGTYYVYAEEGRCKSDTVKVEVTFETQPEVIAVSPQTSCGTSLALQASTTAGDLIWTDGSVKLSGNIAMAGDGKSAYYVYAEDGDCKSGEVKVDVKFGVRPEVLVKEIQTACGKEYTLQASATGGDLYWLKADRKTSQPSAQITGEGTQIFHVYALDGNCSSDTVRVEVKFGSSPELVVAPTQTSCGTSLTLEATTSGGELVWTKEGSNVPLTSTLVNDDEGKGTYTYYVHAEDRTCKTEPQPVEVKFNTKPEVKVNDALSACGLEYTLHAETSGGTLHWFEGSTELTNLTVKSTSGLPTVYSVYADQGNGCKSDSKNVVVYFNTDPVVTVQPLITTCDESIELQASTTGGSLKWTDDKGFALTSTKVSGTKGTSKIYYVKAVDGACYSATEKIEVRYGAKPEVIVSDPFTVCTKGTLVATATGGEVHWLTSAGTPLTSLEVEGPNSKTYKVYAEDKCGQSDVKTVTVNFGDPVLTVDDQSTCNSPYRLQAKTSAGTLQWENTLFQTVLGGQVKGMPGTTDTYTVTATDGSCSVSKTIQVTFGDKPVVSLTDQYCMRDTLWTYNENESTTVAEYRWFVDGELKATNAEGYYVFDKSGKQTVQVVAADAGGCVSDTAKLEYNIAAPVHIDWTTVPPTTLAYGKDLNGCVDVKSGSTNVTWKWLSPSNLSGKCFYIRATDFSYDFKVYAVDEYNCVSDTASIKTTITGFGALNVTLVSEYGTEVCDGGTAFLKAEANGGVAPYIYNWYVKGQTVPFRTVTSNIAVDIVNVAPKAATDYVVKISDGAGTPNIGEAEIGLTLSTGHTLAVADAGADMAVKSGGQTVLSGSATGSAPFNYHWMPVGALRELAEATKQYAWTGKLTADQQYMLYVADADNCVSLPDIVNVKVDNSGVIVKITPEKDSICLGNTTNIAITSTPAFSSSAVYTWSTIDGLVATKDKAVFTPTAPGDYTVVVQVNDGGRLVAAKSQVHVRSTQTPEFALTVSGTGNCQGDTLKVVYAEGAAKASDYTWKVKGTTVGEKGDSLILSSVGTYLVEVTGNVGDCASKSVSRNVTVNAAPVISDLVVKDSCGQAVVEVTATGVTAGYSWTSDQTGAVDALKASRYMITQVGDYDVTVTADNGVCTAKRSLKGTVYGRPTLKWIFEPVDVMRDEAITATAGVDVTTTAPYVYHWLQPTAKEGEANYKVDAATLANYTFEVYATDAKGCLSDTLDKLVNVTGGDVQVTLVSVYGNTVCKDGAAMLVAEAQGGSAPCTFEWYRNSAVSHIRQVKKNVLRDTLWVDAADVEEYRVNLYQNDLLKDYKSLTLTIDNAKQAPVIAVEPTLTVPNGGSTVLPAWITTQGTVAYKWHWSPANQLGSLADTALQNPVTKELTANQSYRVYVTDAAGCVSSPENTDVKVDNVNGLCVTAIPDVKEICRHNSLWLVAEATCGVTNPATLNYTWRPADSLNIATGDSVLFKSTKEGEFVYTVTVKNGSYAAAARVNVTVKAADAPVLALSGKSDCVNDTLVVSNVGEAVVNYVWTADGVVTAETGLKFALTNVALKHVEVYGEAANGCRSDLQAVDLNLGIVPDLNILEPAMVAYKDSVVVLHAENTEGLNTTDYTLTWSSTPGLKIDGDATGMEMQTVPVIEDVKYELLAVSNANNACKATDTARVYIIPDSVALDIDKNADGQLVLKWDHTKPGLDQADSIRVMTIKWNGYAVDGESYQPTAMEDIAKDEYLLNTDNDTLVFFYVNTSRYISELNRSYYSRTSDTVGYFKQEVHVNSGNSNGYRYNYITYPFDMSLKGLLTSQDLGKYLGQYTSGANVGKNIVNSVAKFDIWNQSWSVLNDNYLVSLGIWVSAQPKFNLKAGDIYRIFLNSDAKDIELLFYGKLPERFAYDLSSMSNNEMGEKGRNYIAYPLSMSKVRKLTVLGDKITSKNSIAIFQFQTAQDWSTFRTNFLKTLNVWTKEINGYGWLPLEVYVDDDSLFKE